MDYRLPKLIKINKYSRKDYVMMSYILFLIVASHVTVAVRPCPACVNGVRKISNIFASCKCICDAGFTGPLCEVSGKRKKSVPNLASFLATNRDGAVDDVIAMEGVRQQVRKRFFDLRSRKNALKDDYMDWMRQIISPPSMRNTKILNL